MEEEITQWDANTYDIVSNPQEEWGKSLVRKIKWIGNENVLDAGCGSGRVTKILSEKAFKGMIYAVDNDTNMLEKAKKNLSSFKNIKIIMRDLNTIELANIPIKFDIIFSNAVLHWIIDHNKVFNNFYNMLKNGGKLCIQCGGYGNLQKTITVFDNIKNSMNFRDYFSNWKISWNFAKPLDTRKILNDIGYKDIEVYLSTAHVNFDSKDNYTQYIKTVVLRRYLQYLPSQDLKNQFLNDGLNEIENNHQNLRWNLDYERLNISASK